MLNLPPWAQKILQDILEALMCSGIPILAARAIATAFAMAVAAAVIADVARAEAEERRRNGGD